MQPWIKTHPHGANSFGAHKLKCFESSASNLLPDWLHAPVDLKFDDESEAPSFADGAPKLQDAFKPLTTVPRPPPGFALRPGHQRTTSRIDQWTQSMQAAADRDKHFWGLAAKRAAGVDEAKSPPLPKFTLGSFSGGQDVIWTPHATTSEFALDFSYFSSNPDYSAITHLDLGPEDVTEPTTSAVHRANATDSALENTGQGWKMAATSSTFIKAKPLLLLDQDEPVHVKDKVNMLMSTGNDGYGIVPIANTFTVDVSAMRRSRFVARPTQSTD